MRHSPNRDDFDLTLAHRLQGGLNGLHSLLVGPVRRVAGEYARPLLDIDTVQRMREEISVHGDHCIDLNMAEIIDLLNDASALAKGLPFDLS